jgi:glycosyltransferase involved in cell wall biosynthesis
MTEVSIVIPARDERAALAALLPEIREVLSGLQIPYEVIVVDDASRDGTFDLLASMSQQWPELAGIQLRASIGQTGALQAGFDRAGGKVVLTLDGDGQNDPHDIPKLLDKIAEGFDVVSGWRTERKDAAFSRRMPSAIANALIRRWSGSKLNDQGCALKAYRREILKDLRIYGEQHRFIAALAEGLGAATAEVPVNHRPRQAGQSHYGWGRLPRVLLDLLFLKYILNYSHRPLHLFGGAGLLSFLAGFLACLDVTFEKLVFRHPAAERPLLQLGVLLIVVGVILVSLGILAELLVRSYHEMTGKPPYRIQRSVGGTSPKS